MRRKIGNNFNILTGRRCILNELKELAILTPLYLNERQVSELTGISLSKLRNDRFLRKGIPYNKIGKSVRYENVEIKKFMDQCKIRFDNYI